MQKLLPPVLVFILLVSMVVASLLAPWPSLPWLLRVCGAPVAGLGLMLSLRNAGLFDRLGTNIMTFDDPDILVDTGAFARTRNPMYLGMFVFLGGAALVSGSAVAAFGPATFFYVADHWYIPFEERRMSATFGDAYADYRSRVRRWIGPSPRPGRA